MWLRCVQMQPQALPLTGTCCLPASQWRRCPLCPVEHRACVCVAGGLRPGSVRDLCQAVGDFWPHFTVSYPSGHGKGKGWVLGRRFPFLLKPMSGKMRPPLLYPLPLHTHTRGWVEEAEISSVTAGWSLALCRGPQVDFHDALWGSNCQLEFHICLHLSISGVRN